MTDAAPSSWPWFAVWTRSRHEQAVREQLGNKRFDVFLPTITRWSRWKDRKKKVDWPLFPGYCFARFDPNDSIRRNLNPLYDVPLTNVQRTLFYWPHVVDFYTGEQVSSDILRLVVDM